MGQKAYIQGVSTRSVDDLVKALGMSGISTSQVSRQRQIGLSRASTSLASKAGSILSIALRMRPFPSATSMKLAAFPEREFLALTSARNRRLPLSCLQPGCSVTTGLYRKQPCLRPRHPTIKETAADAIFIRNRYHRCVRLQGLLGSCASLRAPLAPTPALTRTSGSCLHYLSSQTSDVINKLHQSRWTSRPAFLRGTDN